ncbi:MAG: VacJ family lipoprotein [Pseudomonadota bacterium]
MPGMPLLLIASPLTAAGLAPPPPVILTTDLPQASITAAPPISPPVSLPRHMLVLGWSLAPQSERGAPAQRSEAAQQQPDEPPGEETESQSGDDGEDNEIVVEGTYGPSEADPIEEINAESFRITQQIDEAFVEPLAYAYRDGLPEPIRDGLGNVVRNLGEPNNALNFLLQGKIGKTFETLTRLAINSTLGIGGLFDIAEKEAIDLPYRRNGFANTMGFYGIGPGPYLYLPVTGATTARDVVGSGLDQLLLPVAVGEPFNRLEFAAPYFVINSLDSRLELDEEIKAIRDTVDPYAARRDTYLYRRRRDIALLRGEEPPEPPAILREIEEGVDYLDEEEDGAGVEGETGVESETPTASEPPLSLYFDRGAISVTKLKQPD